MKVFHCDHCGHLLFFENVECVQCKHKLGFLPDAMIVASLEPAAEGHWTTPAASARGRQYRLCKNYSQENVCNWTVPVADAEPLCSSCRLTRVIPDLTQEGNREAWYRLETAKRRLVYTLIALRLPLTGKAEHPETGVQFRFLADTPTAKAMTGHDQGVITVNVAEADDAERERRRLQLREPYRTLLGHFRHEVGHHYWDQLVKDSDWLGPFRDLFGDERADYGAALKHYYETGAPADWQARSISAYATAHPWEDWAETWAHYLHMTDTLEMAATCGLALQPRRGDEPSLKPDQAPLDPRVRSFDQLIDRWYPLTYLLNNLNRGLGLPDGYPFVLSARVVEKLGFVHEVIAAAS